MDCEVTPITCELSRIADALQGFDWNSFVATLLATLAGAAVAAFVSYLVYRGERSERYTAALNDAAATVMIELHNYSQDYRRFVRELTEWAAAKANAPNLSTTTQPREPDRAGLDIALDVLIVKGRRSDRGVAEAVKRIAYELTFTSDPAWLASEYQTVRRVVAAWRSGRRSISETLVSLTRLDERRQLKQSGKAEEHLPPSPEPYERPAPKG